MKKKAIIFDMDGVLVDSENAYLNLFRDFLAKHQKEIKEDILLKIVGADTRMTWNYMSMLWGPQDPPEYIRQLFHSEYPGMRQSIIAITFSPVFLIFWIS